jgi:hypothetical protein
MTGVSAGEGRGVGVDASGWVAVGDDTASVETASIVCVGEEAGTVVAVSDGDGDVARPATGFARGVSEGVIEAAEAAPVGEADAGGASDGGEVGLHRRTKKRINRRIATISLKRSYRGARLESSIARP